MPFLPCAWSRAPVGRFHKWGFPRGPPSRPLAVARPSHSARYISRQCVSYFTVGRESRAAPGRQFNRPFFHLGVEQFDRGAGPMSSGIEIGGHPAATKRGLVIQTELVVSPYGGLPAAIRNDLASAISKGEARQNKP